VLLFLTAIKLISLIAVYSGEPLVESFRINQKREFYVTATNLASVTRRKSNSLVERLLTEKKYLLVKFGKNLR
jgi:hypothetical protein